MSEDTQILEPAAKKQKLDNAELEDVNNLEHDFTQDIDTSEAAESCPVNEKYDNYVTIEELQKLREFQVLDEVKSNDEDSNAEESDSSDGKSDGLPEEELEKMLDEGLPEDFKSAPKPKEKAFITRQKVVLEEKGINHFEVLPLDWLMARHYSGMPIYMHRSTRVCTLAKPYFLGKGNTRRHDIPISAIPCLAYRKALEEERKQKQIDKDIDDQIKHGTWQQTADKNKTNHETQDKGGKASENRKTGSGKNKEVEVSKCPVNSVNDRQSATQTNEAQKSPVNSSEDSRERNEDATLEHDNIIAEDNVQEDIENVTDLTHNSGDISNCPFNNTGSIQDSKESGKDEVQTENNVEEDITNESETPKCPFNNEIKKHEDVVNNDKCLSPNDNIEAVTKDEDTTGTNNIDSEGKVNDVPLNRQPVVLPGGIVMPPPRVETVSTSWKTQHLTQEQVNEYCRKLFKFKTVSVMHFKRWADRRKYTKARKTLQYPTLPEGTKLITIPAQPATGQDNGGNKSTKRDWVMNMNGRSYLSVFHEYVRRALQKQPVYEFKQLENAATPYQATVYIGGMQYGVGHGSSKRSAKSAAARASIHILIPEMGAELETATPNPTSTEPDFSFFDYVGIEDPRITEFCAATCEPSPHAILRTCLLRNFGAGDRHIHTEMKKLEYQKIELTMKVGKHTATVVCKNKKTAKQRASQSILQALHPHVRSWGSLLRLYGSRSVKSCKEKKLEEQQITLLQDSARHNEPNYAVLEKLRNEMIKLRERDEAVVSIGTLLVKDDLPTHSGSNLNNVDL